ncbi:MAG: ECF transporter S component [Ruminococcus sp.]|nr:ECF transporter S component [Ruminococcus sp.]
MTKTEKRTQRIKMLCAMAMLTALAIVVDFFLRIPNIGGILTYEPKDAVLTIGAFIFGVVPGLIMSFVVCLVEMLTISTTGPIGLLMNFLPSAVFVVVSSLIYHRRKTLSRAIIGLVAGSLSMVIIMLLWNYIITPIYMGVPREAVLELFLPLIIPFNVIKVALNSALVLFLYKGVVTALRKSRLIPTREDNDTEKKKNTIIMVCASALLTVTFILVLLIFAKII